MRLSSVILWRIILANPWNIHGNKDVRLDVGCVRLKGQMLSWEDQHVPADRKITNLTISMLGGKTKHCNDGAEPHPGSILKLKAAECGTILEFCVAILPEYLGVVPHGQELLLAGNALLSWLAITRSESDIVSALSLQEMRTLGQRFLLNCERASVSFTPKFHFFAHLSEQAFSFGNPKMYSTWLDESLNRLLRDIAASAHRSRQAERIFRLMSLQADLGLAPYMYSKV